LRKGKDKKKRPTFGPSGYRLGDGIIEWLMGVEFMCMLQMNAKNGSTMARTVAFIGRGSRGGVQ